MIEGLGNDVGGFDNASHRHLVDQQFENGFVLMVVPLLSGDLNITGKRLTTDAAIPAGITHCGLAERGIRSSNSDGYLIGTVSTGLVRAVHRTTRREVGCHPLDFFYDAEVALERESYGAERANTRCNLRENLLDSVNRSPIIKLAIKKMVKLE
jgi:hypothetical protein